MRPASGDGGAEPLGLEALGVAQPALAPGRAPERREVSSRSWDNPGFVPPLTEYRTFPSVAAGGAVGYAVYLPPGDGAPFPEAHGANGVARRYPVVYWLHGMGGGPWRGARFVERFDQAIREGLIPPAIAVLPTGGPRSMYADARDGSWPVETVLVRELIPHVDATYPTLAAPGARAAGSSGARGGARARIIEGQSTGGWGAARLGFGYPELFGAVSISAGALISLDRERQSPRFQAVWGGDAAAFEEADPRTIVRRNASRIKALGQRVRIFLGGEDRLLEANRTFHALLDQLGIAHEYVEVPGAGHGYDDKVDRLGLPFFAWFGGASSIPPESSPESSPAMR